MDNWVVVYVSTLSNNVYMVQSYLESEGIETMLQNELMAQIYFNTMGGVRLLVSKDDYERSIELLHQGGYIENKVSAEPEPIEVIKSPDKTKCPYCNSDHIQKKEEVDKITSAIFVVFIFLINHLFPPVFKRKRIWICWDCGKSWKYK